MRRENLVEILDEHVGELQQRGANQIVRLGVSGSAARCAAARLRAVRSYSLSTGAACAMALFYDLARTRSRRA
jgi:hypothetical protein